MSCEIGFDIPVEEFQAAMRLHQLGKLPVGTAAKGVNLRGLLAEIQNESDEDVLGNKSTESQRQE